MANATNRLLPPCPGVPDSPVARPRLPCANGRQAEQLQDYDRAIVEYTKVLRSQPDNREARQALDRARLRAAADHYARGRRLEAGGRLDEALVELQLAAELNPNSQDSAMRWSPCAPSRETRSPSRGTARPARDAHRAGAQPHASGYELPNDVRLPASLTFRDAPSRDVFTALARFANINVMFDPQFRDQPVTIDLRETSLETALQALSAATRSFYRVTGPRSITVVPDTAAKRQEYEEEIVRTFPLSNADLKETVDLLRIVIDARRLAPVTATNTIAIKDTPARVAAAGKLIAAIDKARPEVVIDVELLEIDRTRLKEYGLQIASPTRRQLDRPDGHQWPGRRQSSEPHASRRAQPDAVGRLPHQRPRRSITAC